MSFLEMKKSKDNFEVNLFFSKTSKSHYRNIIDKNPKKLAQILIDLMIEGFPIIEAIKIFNKRVKSRDWLGL
jgi:hypothetical protein